MSQTESLEGTTPVSEDSSSRSIQRLPVEQALATQPYAEMDDARLLDLYGEGGLLELTGTRTDSICKLSAGRKNERGLPEPARDRRIVLHDPSKRAPVLTSELDKTDYKSLIITFDSDRTSDFLISRFALYTRSRCILQGDDRYLMYRPGDQPPQRYDAVANADEYQTLFQWGIQNGMKVEYWTYFHLWKLVDNEPRIWYADGMLPYRIVHTSKTGVQNLLTSFKEVRRLTGGHIALMPFEASIDLRRVTDRTGAVHDNTPIWTFNPKVTEFSLDSRNWIPFVRSAIAQTRDLMEIRMLNPPSSIADADTESDLLQDPVVDGEFREANIVTPTEKDLDRMQHGGQCDAEQTRKAYFAIVSGTNLAKDKDRHAWIKEYTGGQYEKTSDAYAAWSQDEARLFLDATKERVETGVISEKKKPEPQEPIKPKPAEPKSPAEMADEEQVGEDSVPAKALRDLAREAKELGLPPDVYKIGIPDYPAPIGQLRRAYRSLAEHVVPLRGQVKRQPVAPIPPVQPAQEAPEPDEEEPYDEETEDDEDELMAMANAVEEQGAAV